MKKKNIIFIWILLLFMLASCGKQYSTRLDSVEIKDLNFGNKFTNSKVISLRMQIYNSKVYSFEGDLYDQKQVSNFIMDGDNINFLRINEIELNELDYFTLEEIKPILLNVNTFIKDKFQLSSYKIRLFSDSHNISILDENFIVYEYYNGNFLINKEVSQVRTTCLLLYGNDTSMIILLND